MAPWNPGTPGVSALGLASSVALAATLGAWVRYGATQLGGANWRQRPWSTWGVNMVACFLMGLLASKGAQPPGSSPSIVELVGAVGFLGSLSTFSTLTAELVITWQRRARRLTLALGTASLLGGLLACELGLTLGRSQP
jgi:CrcB protein